ncbi:MAG: prepilin-type N-terminal cleavage/methylation domain-containing protein [Candidatus Nomurabacteria bacterium]|nr:prepilin-type N-terminal cleavage/methylation domain-containing protein [Candidatus Nomurabacteria bacterium]
MKKRLKRNSNKGFTLIEMAVSTAIFVIILIALTLLARNIWTYNSTISKGFTNVAAGKKAIKMMEAEIRTASAANNGSYAVNQASATSFTFFSDINGDGLKERIRYFMNGSSLQKGTLIPTGSPLGYTGTETVTTLLTNVTNTATIFNYYDTNYDGTTAALTIPLDVSVVRLVKITLTLDDNPNLPPAPITFTTQISLRNVKDNL